MENIAQDVRYALRQLHKRLGFTAVAVITLALGIGASTAIFSVVYGVLLRPLPYSDPSRIMAVFEVTPKGEWNRLADPNFDDFRDQNSSFQAIAKYSAGIASVSGAGQPTRSMVANVSAEFLNVFRVQPTIGRGFVPADMKKGAAPVVLVSYGYWRQNLSSRTDLSQLHLKIDNAIYSVIGVLPDTFEFPSETALWIPADTDGENPSRTSHNYSAVARLRDGVTSEQANAEISAIARRIHDSSSEQNGYLLKDAAVVPLQESITGKVRPALLVLLGAVGFLLLVACANVANLLLAQASARERELGIRSALGAERGRLIRQFLTEAFVLSFIAGGLGIAGAFFGLKGLVALAPENLPRLDSVSINVPVLGFALLVSMAVAVGLGAFTAFRATSGNVREILAEGGRGQAGSQSSRRIGRGIVAAQIAITSGSRGGRRAARAQLDEGARSESRIPCRQGGHDGRVPALGELDDAKAKANEAAFFSNLIDRLKQIPGVRKVGATSVIPMDGGLPNGGFLLMTQDQIPKAPQSDEALSREFDRLFQQKERLGDADFCVATDGILSGPRHSARARADV